MMFRDLRVLNEALAYSWDVHALIKASSSSDCQSCCSLDCPEEVRFYSMLLLRLWINGHSFNSASFRPWQWIRQQLSPAVREEPSQKEVAAARKEQVEKGHGSIFDRLAIEKEKDQRKERLPVKWVDDAPIGPRNPDLEVRYACLGHQSIFMFGDS